MPISVGKLTNDQLRNVLTNHRNRGQTTATLYLEAMAEVARREGHGLSFRKTMQVVLDAARKGRFVSYKELADASGVDWGKAHYAIGGHLGDLVEYAHRRNWPLLSAVVVNKNNVATGEMEPATLKGFVAAARALHYTITDEQEFLRQQQVRVFEWAKSTEAAAVLSQDN